MHIVHFYCYCFGLWNINFSILYFIPDFVGKFPILTPGIHDSEISTSAGLSFVNPTCITWATETISRINSHRYFVTRLSDHCLYIYQYPVRRQRATAGRVWSGAHHHAGQPCQRQQQQHQPDVHHLQEGRPVRAQRHFGGGGYCHHFGEQGKDHIATATTYIAYAFAVCACTFEGFGGKMWHLSYPP